MSDAANIELDLDIQVAVEGHTLPSEEQIEQWVLTALAGRVDKPCEMCVRICDPSESQSLNNEYRGKNKPTNVLSFDIEAPDDLPVKLLGDLVICAEVVETEASEQGKPLFDHWTHMVLHGTLHLLGYDHINDEDAQVMESLETELLASLNISDPYTLQEDTPHE